MLALLLLVACGPQEEALQPPTAMVPVATEPPAAAGWAAELAALDAQLAFHTARFEETGSWQEAERAAAVLHQRGRLTGDLDDYIRAEALLARGIAAAPAGGGPLLARARLHFTLHRLPAAEADLDLVEAQPLHTATTLQAIADLRADLALERGQLDAAEAHWRAAEASKPSLKGAAALGRIAWLRGDFATADALLAAAQERYHATAQEPLAWIHLQRGLLDLDQGDPASALAHYRDAEAALPGYWLVDEHIAEALALLGQTDAALARYRDVVARTGNPELQGALAELLLEQGAEDEARQLLAAAEATYAAQLQKLPEAAAGHALEHALRWDTDPARALAMAEQNAALRPSAAALGLLAEARLAAGDLSGAQAAVDRALATGTRSAELFRTAAATAQAAGDDRAAADWLAQAQAIDPTVTL